MYSLLFYFSNKSIFPRPKFVKKLTELYEKASAFQTLLEKYIFKIDSKFSFNDEKNDNEEKVTNFERFSKQTILLKRHLNEIKDLTVTRQSSLISNCINNVLSLTIIN